MYIHFKIDQIYGINNFRDVISYSKGLQALFQKEMEQRKVVSYNFYRFRQKLHQVIP